MNLKIRKVKPTNSRFLFYPERRHLMSEGLRPHRHCYFEVESRKTEAVQSEKRTMSA